jgi:hypothetical protein
MNCQQCGSKIGFVRLLSDRQYCSDEHRRKALEENARSRRARWVYGDEDLYDVYEILDQPADENKKKQMAKVQAGAAMALSIVLVFVLAFSWMGNGPSSGPPVVDKTGLMAKLGNNATALGNSSGAAGFVTALQGMIPTRSPIRLKEDFKAGLDAWVGAVGAAADWSMNNDGALAPGKLRIWQPSVNLANYKVEFEAEIDKKALNWTYRSLNLDNFYASKIVQKRPGSLEIVRYAVLDGREQTRTKLPIPLMPAQANRSLYRVQMQVRGEQFTTLLNGQVVDTWTDTRLRRGGVGFFSEPGERSLIHWVSVNEEREGLLGQILSLGFFVPPTF